MYLYIKGFRTIQQYECEFHSQSITLISGTSGAGKTTLMNAILWCLYGKLKNVRKFGTKSGACIVKIELGNIKITRSKSPESLIFEQEELVFKDDEAQSKVLERFGTHDIWLSCCYLRQGSRNKFLESSPSERLALLSELCFSSHSPDIYLEKIDEKSKETTKEFERQNDFYKRELELFQKKRKENPKYKEDILTKEQKDNYIQRIHSNEISVLEEHLSTCERLESSYLSLLETKNQWVTKFPNYKGYLIEPEQKVKLLEILKEDKSNYSPHNQLKHLETEIQNLMSRKILYETYLDEFNKKSSSFPDYKKFIFTSSQIEEYRQHVSFLINQIENLEKQWRETTIQRSNYENWTKELHELDTKVSCLPHPDQIQISLQIILEKIQEVKTSNEIQRKLSELQSRLSEFEDVWYDDKVEIRNVSLDEINRSVFLEKRTGERKDLIQKLSIQDNKESVQKGIDVRRRVCEIQFLWNYISELQDLEMKIDEYDGKIKSLGKRKDWITEEELPKKILELNTLRETLICPKCSTGLRFDNGRLMECHTNISKDKVDQFSKWIEDSKKRLEWTMEKQKLDYEMSRKVEHFETECQRMSITQEQLYEYPKLEESDKQKIFLEILELERYISTYDEEYIPANILQSSHRKWCAHLIWEQIKDVEKCIDKSAYETLDELEHRKEECILKLSRLELWTQSMEELKKKIEKCSFHEDVSSDKIDQMKEELERTKVLLQNYEKSKEIDDLSRKMDELDGSDLDTLIESKRKELDLEWTRIEKERKEWEEAKSIIQKAETANTINELDKKISEIIFDDPKEIKVKIDKWRAETEIMKEKIGKSEKAEELLNEKMRLEKQRLDVIELSNQVSVISTMKSIANELEHKRMISILSTINDFANELLTILFDEPIKIEFMVYKTLKNSSHASDKTKPSIVYKLLYRGYEMDHVDQLSGGEGDRVSLAVTCALFQMSKFPFLLLDEFAASLDLNTKEMAIKSLKTFLGVGMNQYKSILCISHDTVEGIYDYIINMNQTPYKS